VSAPAANAGAAMSLPFYGGSIPSWLRAALLALQEHQVVLEAELVTAESAWAATDDGSDDQATAQDALDAAAGRLTYCLGAIAEVERALALVPMSTAIPQ